MFPGIPLGEESQSRIVNAKLRMARWNPFVLHWSIALDALRQLWETGKVSELKSPFYEPVEKPRIQ
ncbi:MAG TPA: hypothetical protein VK897_26630 [Anaerolineales bacterium]|nr:hypothetical protein [Anaerolineales bacterium]